MSTFLGLVLKEIPPEVADLLRRCLGDWRPFVSELVKDTPGAVAALVPMAEGGARWTFAYAGNEERNALAQSVASQLVNVIGRNNYQSWSSWLDDSHLTDPRSSGRASMQRFSHQ